MKRLHSRFSIREYIEHDSFFRPLFYSALPSCKAKAVGLPTSQIKRPFKALQLQTTLGTRPFDSSKPYPYKRGSPFGKRLGSDEIGKKVRTMFMSIIFAMLLAGTLGGLINFYLTDPEVEKPLAWWKHIVAGVGASFIVPVFLNMISSRLISEIDATGASPEALSKLLLLGGFCLLAAISSRTFIRSMSDKLLREISIAKKDAKEALAKAENAEIIADLSVEPEQGNDTKSLMAKVAGTDTIPVLNEVEKKVLTAMINNRFSMRSITGIANQAAIAKHEVNQALGPLLEKSLIAEGKSKEGQPRWYPTPAGRQANLLG